jgi:hypothetical protein
MFKQVALAKFYTRAHCQSKHSRLPQITLALCTRLQKYIFVFQNHAFLLLKISQKSVLFQHKELYYRQS